MALEALAAAAMAMLQLSWLQRYQGLDGSINGGGSSRDGGGG